MHSVPDKGVAFPPLPDPAQFANKELLRHAEFYLYRDNGLPVSWQLELIKRFSS